MTKGLKWTRPDVARLVQMHKEGKTDGAMATELHRSVRSVVQKLHALGKGAPPVDVAGIPPTRELSSRFPMAAFDPISWGAIRLAWQPDHAPAQVS